MSHAAQYRSDESDSEAENGYSDNEGIVFAESNRKNSEDKQNSMPASKNRAKAPKHELDEGNQGQDGVRLKKRRRTVEVNDLPLHDDDDLPPNAPITLKFKSRIWNEAMDQELDLAAKEYDRDWSLVCTRLNELFQSNLTNSQCQKRWAQYITPEISDRKIGPWSADEVSLLHILVEQHSKEVQGKVRISWDTVSRLINRRYYDCQNKWNTIKKATLKVGRFTAEEDEIIRRTVTEWDGNGVRQGLWIQLQNELGRRNDVIRKRWSAILAKRPSNAGLDNFAPGQQ